MVPRGPQRSPGPPLDPQTIPDHVGTILDVFENLLFRHSETFYFGPLLGPHGPSWAPLGPRGLSSLTGTSGASQGPFPWGPLRARGALVLKHRPCGPVCIVSPPDLQTSWGALEPKITLWHRQKAFTLKPTIVIQAHAQTGGCVVWPYWGL